VSRILTVDVGAGLLEALRRRKGFDPISYA
jgi:hypothetical protein